MQAARGASLTGDGEATGPSADPCVEPDPVAAPRRRTPLLLAVALLVTVADQVTKQLAADRLGDGHVVRVVGDLLKFHLARNSGAAFSTGTGYTQVISVVALAAFVFVLWLSTRVRTPWWAVTLGVLLGGITGNLADRIFRAPAPLRGHVVDFLELPHWPIFNLADTAINVGAALILLLALRGVRVDCTHGK